jgi:hypothetical protein
MNMKKTRAPRTRIDSLASPLRELSRDELDRVAGGMIFGCPGPKKPDDYTETWPKHDTDLMDFD